MRQTMYKLYKHTFPNGKVYIGITSQSLEDRFQNGRGYSKCPKMHNAILKYGWNNVEHELLADGLTKPEAESKEIETIAFYNSVENGYNADHGGNATGTHSKETRAKISAAGKGKKKPPVSEQRKLDYSARYTGAGNPFYGKHHTEETKSNHSAMMRGNKFNKGKHHTDEFKAWKSAQMKAKYANGGNPRSKRVVQTDKSGNERIFNSLRLAAEYEGVSPSTMLNYIKNGVEICGKSWGYQNGT